MKKCGLAMWHYQHRTTVENVKFFAENGFEVLALNQWQIVDCILAEDKGALLAESLYDNNLRITVHGGMPVSHKLEDVNEFKKKITLISEWQKKYGLIDVISFDVFDAIRDNMSSYIDFVLDKIENCKVAVEDFGLNENELSQIEHLRNNDRFGYLIDIGHMYIRLTGKPVGHETLFQHSDYEGERTEYVGYEEFLKAFQSKTFPIYEVHLHNNDGVDDLHLFLEDGTLDMKIIADILKELKYDGIVTIESAPGFRFACAGAMADEGIIKTYNYWKNI